MAFNRKGALLLAVTAALAVGTGAWFYLSPGKRSSRAGTRTAPARRPTLDPATDRLSDAYMDPNLRAAADYEESPYPAAFASDGLGPLETRPFLSMHVEQFSPDYRERLQASCKELERNPRNLELLERIALELGRSLHCSRMVPFADRLRAAGGKLDLRSTGSYATGLVRLGRVEDARKAYREALERWGPQRTKLVSAMMYKDLFLRAWFVDQNLAAMLEALREGSSTALTDTDRYYVQEVVSEHLRRAAGNRELEWFLPRLERSWIWFTEDRLKAVIGLLSDAKLEVPDSLRQAADPLLKGASAPPPVFWLRALASMSRGDLETALRQAERAVELSSTEDRFVRLQAQMILVRILRSKEDLEQALQATRRFEQMAEEAKADDQIGWGRVMRGYIYERLADHRGASEAFRDAARIGERLDYDEMVHTARSAWARAMCEIGFASEVEAFLRSNAESALAQNVTTNVAPAYADWGRCLCRLGRYEEAIAALSKPEEYASKKIGQGYDIDHSVLLRCIQDVGFAQLALRRYREAEATYTEGAALVRKSHAGSADWPWQLGMARARRGLGDVEGARRLIDECIRTVDAERASLKDFQHRRTLNDNKYGVYALALELAVERKDADEAFRLSERARARAFLDELGSSGSPRPATAPISLPEAATALKDVTLVSYFQLSDRLLAWVFREGSVDLILLENSDADHVRLQVEAFLRAIASEGPAALEQARKTYDLLWRPLEAKVGTSGRLCIVPHGVLHYVPFQALHDGIVHLIEKREIFYAAGVNALSELRHRRIDPAAGFLGLDSIQSDDPKSPFAKTEIQALQAMHPDGRFFLRDRATPEAFNTQAVLHGVVHVSSHGTFNPWIPLDSGLVLAPENAGDKRLLRARDIHRLRFDRTSLLVMSACVSSVGDLAAGDEVSGLTRAFQVAGVPTVIGSLWPVENSATTSLMTEFHSRLSRTADPLSSLREAQRRMIQLQAPISRWAAFEVTGDGKTLVRSSK